MNAKMRQELERQKDLARLAAWGGSAKAPTRPAPKPDPAQLSIMEMQLDLEWDAIDARR